MGHDEEMETKALQKQKSLILEFDRGTIVLDNLAPEIAPHLSDLIKWDERINGWRAPAFLYARLSARIRNLGAVLVDRVRHIQIPHQNWSTITLRPYQEAALLAWRAANGRGIVCLPTGSGKTRVALAAAQRTGKSTLCLVPTRVLLHQWVKAIRENYSGEIGILGDGQHSIKPITVATFESAFRSAWSYGNRFDLLIVDETHHFGSGERDEALEACAATFRLGLSATLDDERQKRLDDLIGSKVFEQKLDELVGTALSDFEIYCFQLPLTQPEKNAYRMDYEVFQKFFKGFQLHHPAPRWADFLQIASKSADGRAALAAQRRAKKILALTETKLSMLCQILNRHASQRKLIFTSDSETALHLARLLLMAAITAEISQRERVRILDDFRSGKISTLISCKVLNEGFDVPDADIAIIVGGSGSDREYIQRIGRVLRPREGKKAQIYELLSLGTAEILRSRRRGNSLRERRHEKFGIQNLSASVPG